MHIINIYIFIFGVSTAFASGSTISCINPFTLVGDQCLFFGGDWSMNHDNSKDICNQIGGWLARITSATQHKAIVDHVNASSELDHSYWVDGSDLANNNIWLFSNGKLVPRGTPFWRTEQIDDENNTYIQRPDPSYGATLNCLSLQKSFYYFFSDEYCSKQLSPLCEVDVIEGVQFNKGALEHHTSGNITSEKIDNANSLCGEDHVGWFGTITTPLYPLGPPNNIECPHTITIHQDLVTPQSFITLTFTSIIGNCATLDYVEVRDGLDISSPILTNYTSAECCDSVSSTGSHMFLLMHIDSDTATSCGVMFNWIAENTECGRAITGVEGTLHPPTYSGHYFNNLDCQWTITSTPELSTPYTHIIISITKFDTEVGNDYLIIRDGDNSDAPILANLSGHELTAPSLHSTGQHLHFYFHTDELKTYEGFTIDWRAEICPSSYMILSGMCLKFIWRDLSWGEASVSCQAEGGQLAAVKEPQQLRDIYHYLHNEGIEEDSFWLGGSDDLLEGFWIWSDGSVVPKGTPFWGLSSSVALEEVEVEEADNTASNSWNGLFGILKGNSYSSSSSSTSSSTSTSSPSVHHPIQEPNGGIQQNCLALLAEGFHFFRDVPCNWHLKAICSHPLH